MYRPTWNFLRETGAVDLPPECGPVTMRVPGRQEDRFVPPYQIPFTLHTWDTRGADDADWRVAIELLHPPQAPCEYEVIAVDAPRSRVIHVRRAEEIRYPYMDCAAGPGRVTCRLDGRPWRSYALFPVWRRGEQSGLAADVEVLRFHRADALNIRPRAMAQFAGQLAAAAFASVLLFLFRPGGPRGALFSALPRGAAISLVAGLGGAVSALFFALRPADLGGYDEPGRATAVAILVLLAAGGSALFGWLLDWTRRTLVTQRADVSAPAAISVLIFATIGALGFYEAFSSVQKSALLGGLFGQYKSISYLYFVIAVTLPLVYSTDPTWRRHMERGFGSMRPARSRALVLFALVATSGLLATGVAIAAGGILRVKTSGQVIGGYYKPAGGIGTWLCSLPLLFALSLGVNLGEERPRAVQDLLSLLARFANEADGVKRAGVARRVIDLLLRTEIPDMALAQNGRALRSVLAPLNQADLEQIADESGTSPAAIRARLDAVTRAIERAARRIASTPLLLVEDDGGAGRGGRIEARLDGSDPALRAFAVRLNGQTMPPDTHLHGAVLGIARAVAAQIGTPRSGDNPLEAGALDIDLTVPDPGGFHGRSFELPLALTLWALATNRAPITTAWAASGTLDLVSGEVGPVGGVAAKARLLRPGPGGAVLFTAAAALADAGEWCNGDTLLFRPGGDSLRDCAPLRAALRRELQRGRMIVVGVQTFGQAVYLLLGDRP